MKKLNKMRPLFVVTMVFFAIGFFISCSNNDETATGDKVELLSFGPSGQQHGEKIEFIGHNLNRVTSIKFVGSEVQSKDFVSQTSDKIELVIPMSTLEGNATLLFDGGELISKTIISFDVPFMVSNISSDVKPGENLTITGQYLNWVTSVIFSDGIEVTEFESVSSDKLVVKVPLDAKTGQIEIFGGGTKPYTFKSEGDIKIKLPVVTSLDPIAVKHSDMLTIVGTNLDLVLNVKFQGSDATSSFESQSATKIVLQVPNDAKDGKLKLTAFSGVEVLTEQDLKIILPVINTSTPDPVAIGSELTFMGTNLDLIKEVSVPGVDAAITTFVSQSSTKLVLKVPMGSSNGDIKLKTIHDFVIVTTIKINIVGGASAPLKYVIYDDQLQNNFQRWGWGVDPIMDFTDIVFEGTKSIKKGWRKPDGGDGPMEFGNGNVAIAGYSEITLMMYGGVGLTDGGKHRIVINGDWDHAVNVIVAVGKWTEFTIQLADVSGSVGSTLKSLAIQGSDSYTLIDKVGLR